MSDINLWHLGWFTAVIIGTCSLVALLIVTSAWSFVLWLLQRRRYRRMTKRLLRAEARIYRRTRWKTETLDE